MIIGYDIAAKYPGLYAMNRGNGQGYYKTNDAIKGGWLIWFQTVPTSWVIDYEAKVAQLNQ